MLILHYDITQGAPQRSVKGSEGCRACGLLVQQSPQVGAEVHQEQYACTGDMTALLLAPTCS